MEPTTNTPPRGASVWERKMFTYLVEHTQREGQMLEAYVNAADGTQSQALAYLVNVLVEDERRHHRFFNELASSLKSEAELSTADPVIPRLDFNKVDKAKLLDTTDRLLENEKNDYKELKHLHKELHALQDTTLWGLLVEIMLHDTEKHMAILEFVSKHTPKK